MKILILHNLHRTGSASGDDIVFKKEKELLKSHGHDVIGLNPSNDQFNKSNFFQKALIALQAPWSFSSFKKVKEIISKEKPDIVHIHNIFPFLSPSMYYAANAAQTSVIQTLHDFRFLCPMAFFMRGGVICEECKHGSSLRSIRYGCFKDSFVQTIPVALMIELHRKLNTFKKKIDHYICLTESQKEIYLSAGFDDNKISIKPNFIEDTSATNENILGEYAVFIGRIGEEKGVKPLINAWKYLQDFQLKIVGDGPKLGEYKKYADNLGLKSIEFMGYKEHNECMAILDKARFLIMPSIWYETFGLTIVEAFSHKKPVVASRLGAMADIVDDGRTGLLFKAGGPEDMAKKVKWLWDDPEKCIQMGENARKEYEERYTPEINYESLMNIYNEAIERKKRSNRIN